MGATAIMTTPAPAGIQLPKWVRAKKYEEISGISVRAMEAKRTNGVWIEGVHWKRAPDSTVMINWRAVDDWVESTHIH